MDHGWMDGPGHQRLNHLDLIGRFLGRCTCRWTSVHLQIRSESIDGSVMDWWYITPTWLVCSFLFFSKKKIIGVLMCFVVDYLIRQIWRKLNLDSSWTRVGSTFVWAWFVQEPHGPFTKAVCLWNKSSLTPLVSGWFVPQNHNTDISTPIPPTIQTGTIWLARWFWRTVSLMWPLCGGVDLVFVQRGVDITLTWH